jgi:hypothetical protein
VPPARQTPLQQSVLTLHELPEGLSVQPGPPLLLPPLGGMLHAVAHIVVTHWASWFASLIPLEYCVPHWLQLAADEH